VTVAAIGHTWQAFTRDSGYRLTGGLPIRKTAGVLRHLGVDTCELTTTYTPERYGRLAPGCGAVIQRDGVQQFSGMVGSSRRIGWDGRQATITVQLLGDDQHAADRLVLPSPLAAPDAQTADYWTYTGPASTAMWRLIREQLGPGAAPARRVPALVMGTDPGIGVSRLWSEQFATVLDTVTQWGVLSGADLGVRFVTTPDGLRADIYAPRDVSAGVRFSANLANLTGWDYEQTPPEVTVAVAAGQGDLASRVRRVSSSVRAADLAWGRRIERYVDQRDEADPVKLQTSADDEIAAGIGTVSLTVTARDATAQRYGEHWSLGDRVTVHVGLPGQPTVATVVDLIREVAFSVDGNGAEKITPAIGTSDAKAVRPGPTASALADLAGDFARLNRNK
jgi:Siphovirus ReqiPepy6 Gp37-like protein